MNTRETLRKLNDTRSLFVIAALAVALIAAACRLIGEPGRPAISIVADWAIIILVAVINVFSLTVVFKASKAIMTEDEFANVRRAAYNLKRPKDQVAEIKRRESHGITGHGTTTRKMTPDELEGAGLPRDFHSTP